MSEQPEARGVTWLRAALYRRGNQSPRAVRVRLAKAPTVNLGHAAPGTASPISRNDLGFTHPRLITFRRFPERTAPWLCQRIGSEAAMVFRDALSRACAFQGW
jgi:hypothetical protein